MKQFLIDKNKDMQMLLSDIKSLETIDRPREKLKRLGASALTDQELLATLIGNGTKKNKLHNIALDILSLISQEGIHCSLSQLTKIPGLGLSKSAQILAALEFAKRYLQPSHFKIKTASDVYPLLYNYTNEKQEHFICISLNGAYEVIKTQTISKGLVNQTIVHPREVFSDPIKDRCAAIIVAHNHPSGNIQPSDQDNEVTLRLKKSGEILGIPLLDHIIFSKEGFFSYKNHGLL